MTDHLSPQASLKPKVWLKPGILLFYGSNLDTNEHAHHTIQLVFPRANSACFIGEDKIESNLIIGSKVSHKLALEEGWILLVDPYSHLGQRVNQYLGEQTIRTFPSIVGHDMDPTIDANAPLHLFLPYLTMLKKQTRLDDELPTSIDPRIQSLLDELDHCLSGKCRKPSSWRALDVAKQLNISESRFLHLFKQNIGIAWRPYLRWRRLICAVYSLMQGQSATNAAYIAGFSDSAHLSRTFREEFGISIRQIKQVLDS